jgi:hypothetical protein
MDRFQFIVDTQGEFITLDKDNNVIESPVPKKTLKDAYEEGLMAFVKQGKRWTKIQKVDINAPWGGSDKDWENYYLSKRKRNA